MNKDVKCDLWILYLCTLKIENNIFFFWIKGLKYFFCCWPKPKKIYLILNLYSIYCCCSKNNNLYFFPVSDYFKSLILFISKIKVGFLKRFIHPQEPSMYICSSFKHLCIYYLHSSMFFFLFLQLYTWLEPPHRVGSTRTDQNMTTNS